MNLQWTNNEDFFSPVIETHQSSVSFSNSLAVLLEPPTITDFIRISKNFIVRCLINKQQTFWRAIADHKGKKSNYLSICRPIFGISHTTFLDFLDGKNFNFQVLVRHILKEEIHWNNIKILHVDPWTADGSKANISINIDQKMFYLRSHFSQFYLSLFVICRNIRSS